MTNEQSVINGFYGKWINPPMVIKDDLVNDDSYKNGSIRIKFYDGENINGNYRRCELYKDSVLIDQWTGFIASQMCKVINGWLRRYKC